MSTRCTINFHHGETGAWMQGDRFGEVVGFTASQHVRVRMDHSGIVRAVSPRNILEVL